MNNTATLTAPLPRNDGLPGNPARVAVVIEDDKDIREGVLQLLRASGFQAHPAATGREGVAAVRLHRPAVVTLDLTLPDIDGFEVARQVRQFSGAYIVMLTACTEELDTLLAFEAGADDYITKPFRPRELRARIQALLRRAHGQQRPASAAALTAPASEPVPPAVTHPAPASAPKTEPARHSSPALEHNGLVLHPATRTVWANGSRVLLTRTEFDLLLALMENSRTVLSKTRLAKNIRYQEYDTGAILTESDERVIEVHIANLRRKIGDHSRQQRWVQTVRGIGYRLTPAEQHGVPVSGPGPTPAPRSTRETLLAGTSR